MDTFTLPPQLQHSIRKDFGIHYDRFKQYDSAIQDFTKAIALNEDDSNDWHRRSISKFKKSDIHGAYEDAKTGALKNPDNYQCGVKECQCIYELNEIEDSIKITARKMQNCHGRKLVEYIERIKISIQSYDAVLGSLAGPCFLNLKDQIDRLPYEKKSYTPDLRSKWQKIKETGECDVLSIKEIPIPKLSALDECRLKANYRIYSQMYLGPSADDLHFLNSLVDDPILNLKQTPITSEILNKIVKEGLKTVAQGVKSLRTRVPAYTKKHIRFGNAQKNPQKELFLDHIQNQTSRKVYQQLIKILDLYENQKQEELVDYAEKVLGKYYHMKIKRVFPQKKEFVDEICNIIGLSYFEKLSIDDDMGIEVGLSFSEVFQLPKLDEEDDDEEVGSQFDELSDTKTKKGYIKEKDKEDGKQAKAKLKKKVPFKYGERAAFLERPEEDLSFAHYKWVLKYVVKSNRSCGQKMSKIVKYVYKFQIRRVKGSRGLEVSPKRFSTETMFRALLNSIQLHFII